MIHLGGEVSLGDTDGKLDYDDTCAGDRIAWRWTDDKKTAV